MATIINIGGYRDISSGLKSGTGSLLRMPISNPNDALFENFGQVVLTTSGSNQLNNRRVSASLSTSPNGLPLNNIFSDTSDTERFNIAPYQGLGVSYGDIEGGTVIGQQEFSMTCVLTSSAYLNKVSIKVGGVQKPTKYTLAVATDINPAMEVVFGAIDTDGDANADGEMKILTSSLQLDSLPASGALYISHRKNFPNTLTSTSNIFHTLHFSGSTVHAPTSAVSGTLVPISLTAAALDGKISGSDLSEALRDAVNNNITGLTASAHQFLGQAHTLIKGENNSNVYYDPINGYTLQDCTTFNGEDTASMNVRIEGNWSDKGSVTSIATNSTTNVIIPQPTIGPIRYKAFRLDFRDSSQGFTQQPALTSKMSLDQIQVFEIADFGAFSFNNEYDIEFDDSLLSLQGFTNARYEGTKLKAFAINQYIDKKANPAVAIGTFPTTGFDTGSNFQGWGGDITYGKNPLITSKINAIFLGKSLTDGEEDSALVQIHGHSYATIDKILLIDPETDAIQIISSENTGEIAFKKFITDNFPEGSKCSFKLFESQEGFSNLNQKLKATHQIKFNEGMLMRVYSYTPDTAGSEDGVVGGYGFKHHSDVTDESPVAGFANNLGRSNDYNSARPGGGLFSFGTTAVASASLFTTNSIDFVSTLPDELITYENDINLEIAGELISVVSTSYESTSNPADEAPSLDNK